MAKLVYSAITSLDGYVADGGRQLRQDLTVGGPELAAQAIKAGLVDEYHLFLTPIVVGTGTQSLPHDIRVSLELLDERRFRNGMVHLHYRARS